MTINETAEYYQVSVNTIRRRLQNGLLMGNKVGNKWLINGASPNGATPNHPQQEPEPPALVDQMQARIDSLELFKSSPSALKMFRAAATPIFIS